MSLIKRLRNPQGGVVADRMRAADALQAAENVLQALIDCDGGDEATLWNFRAQLENCANVLAAIRKDDGPSSE